MIKILKMTAVMLVLVAINSGCGKSCNKQTDAKRVFFIAPGDGDTVTSPLVVKFGLEGMAIRPAGEDLIEHTSGHHHILVDNEQGFIDQGQVIPTSDNSIHFGKGQTETTISLAPGKHKLSMQLGNGAHLSYGKELSATITVTVLAQEPKP